MSTSAVQPQGDFHKLWSQLVAKAWVDDSLRQRLLHDPKSIMEEHGLPIPPGMEVKVVQNTEHVIYLPIAVKPPAADLSEEDLSKASTHATACGNDTCSVTYFPVRK
jgi:hypothetical protein